MADSLNSGDPDVDAVFSAAPASATGDPDVDAVIGSIGHRNPDISFGGIGDKILQFGKGAIEGGFNEAAQAAGGVLKNVGLHLTDPLNAEWLGKVGHAANRELADKMKLAGDPERYATEWYQKNLQGKNPEQAGEVLGPKISQAAALSAPLIVGAMPAVAAEEVAPLSVSDQILSDARQAGYVVPPATAAPSVLNRAIEGFAGKASVAQAASIKNQAVTNGLARRALNLPEDAPLTPDTLAESRIPAGNVYEQVKGSGEITASPQYAADLDAINKSSTTIQKDFPKYTSGAQQQIKDLVESLKSETFDSGTAVELSKDLRYNAASNYSASARTGDPTMKALARAQQQAAEALENEVGRHLEATGNKDLAGQWDAARTHIAKTYSVQNALDGAGNVDATKLGKQLLKGKPLSEELETAANFANAFPKAARVLPGKESMPGMSPLDVYGSVAASLAAGNPAPMLLGPGRMAARGLALSRAFQPSGVRAGLGLSEAPQ